MAELVSTGALCGFQWDLSPGVRFILYAKSLTRYSDHNVNVFPAPDVYSFIKYLTYKNISAAGCLMDWFLGTVLPIQT